MRKAEIRMATEIWAQVRGELLETLGKNTFVTWIEPLALSSLQDGVASFDAPTTFVGNWVARNYSDQIRRIFGKAGVSVDRLEFSVPRSAPRPAARTPQPETRAAPPRPSDEPDLPGAPIDQRFAFETFVVGKPNELAHAAARRVAEGGPTSFNPLFLYGGVGLGKTHLMNAIAWELHQRQPQMRVLYLSAEQFMYRFVQALRERQIMDFKELFRSVDVLMVDDVQFIAGKDSTQEEFFHTFNALVDQNKQIVISADRAPGEIKDLEDRIK